MTSFNHFSGRNRDQQDGYERGIWGELEYVDGAGAILKVRGTGGSLDEEAPVMNLGYGFNVPKDFDTEVMLLSLNSDTNQKYAIATIPRDQQRQWPENSGGIQHPANKEKFVEINNDETWLRDGVFKVGNNKEVTITVSGGNVAIDCAGEINLTSSRLTHNGRDVGDTHRHVDTEPGAGLSGVPQP